MKIHHYNLWYSVYVPEKSDSLPVWIPVVAAFAAVLVIVAIVLLVLFLMRRNNKEAWHDETLMTSPSLRKPRPMASR